MGAAVNQPGRRAERVSPGHRVQGVIGAGEELRASKHPQRLRSSSRLAAAVLAMLLIWAMTPAVAEDHLPTYQVLRDVRGNRTATVECDGITSRCVIHDPRGRRVGIIEQEPAEAPPRGPTAEEIIEEEHRDEGLER